ncbi:MAG: 5-(carboxyamino)imidazole ribonucleotide mutase [Flavobacteriales bacterium]
MSAQVGIIMGSQSDLPIMKEAADVLTSLGISFEIEVVSAHRTPERMFSYASEAAGRGIKVIIAGAGGAAHLPGMTASITPLPVIGVPIKSSNSIDGWDSILSILQMPAGVPVATVALNGAKNAGILAAQILGANDKAIQQKIVQMKIDLREKVLQSAIIK